MMSIATVRTASARRWVVVIGAVLGAVGASLSVAPSSAGAGLPGRTPPGIHLGGLHLVPTSGAGNVTSRFTADHACPPATKLANVNTVDLRGVEQTLSDNVGSSAATGGPFGGIFMADMAMIHRVVGRAGVAEQFLFLVDCRTGPGHGTYVDAVVVRFNADDSWQADTAPAGDVASRRSAIVLAGVAVAVIGIGVGVWYVVRRRRVRFVNFGTRKASVSS